MDLKVKNLSENLVEKEKEPEESVKTAMADPIVSGVDRLSLSKKSKIGSKKSQKTKSKSLDQPASKSFAKGSNSNIDGASVSKKKSATTTTSDKTKKSKSKNLDKIAKTSDIDVAAMSSKNRKSSTKNAKSRSKSKSKISDSPMSTAKSAAKLSNITDGGGAKKSSKMAIKTESKEMDMTDLLGGKQQNEPSGKLATGGGEERPKETEAAGSEVGDGISKKTSMAKSSTIMEGKANGNKSSSSKMSGENLRSKQNASFSQSTKKRQATHKSLKSSITAESNDKSKRKNDKSNRRKSSGIGAAAAAPAAALAAASSSTAGGGKKSKTSGVAQKSSTASGGAITGGGKSKKNSKKNKRRGSSSSSSCSADRKKSKSKSKLKKSTSGGGDGERQKVRTVKASSMAMPLDNAPDRELAAKRRKMTEEERKMEFIHKLLVSSVQRLREQAASDPEAEAKATLAKYHFDETKPLTDRKPHSAKQLIEATHDDFASDCLVLVKLYDAAKIDPQKSLFLKILRHLGKKHPNVIQTWDVIARRRGDICVFQEFAPYGNLRDFVARKGAIKVAQAQESAKQLRNGMDFLGDMAVAHRSISPDHVLLCHETDGWLCKLTGFRAAIIYYDEKRDDVKLQPCTKQKKTSKDSAADRFSASFQAPETFGDPDREQFDPISADVWSLGATLYYLLTVKYPYDVSKRNPKIENEIAANVKSIANLPKAGKDVIERMLSIDSAHRISIEQLKAQSWFKEK